MSKIIGLQINQIYLKFQMKIEKNLDKQSNKCDKKLINYKVKNKSFKIK